MWDGDKYSIRAMRSPDRDRVAIFYRVIREELTDMVRGYLGKVFWAENKIKRLQNEVYLYVQGTARTARRPVWLNVTVRRE